MILKVKKNWIHEKKRSPKPKLFPKFSKCFASNFSVFIQIWEISYEKTEIRLVALNENFQNSNYVSEWRMTSFGFVPVFLISWNLRCYYLKLAGLRMSMDHALLPWYVDHAVSDSQITDLECLPRNLEITEVRSFTAFPVFLIFERAFFKLFRFFKAKVAAWIEEKSFGIYFEAWKKFFFFYWIKQVHIPGKKRTWNT